MKILKLSKKVQIILATFFVLVIAGIFVGILTNDNSYGAENTPCVSCTYTISLGYVSNGNGTHNQHLKCSKCGSKTIVNAVQCTAFAIDGYISNNDKTHRERLRCTLCGYTTTGQSSSCHGEATVIPTEVGEGELGYNKHTTNTVCELCNYSWKETSECSGATHKNGHKCEICGKEYMLLIQERKRCLPYTSESHMLYTICTCGTIIECEGIVSPCEFDEDGVCYVCGNDGDVECFGNGENEHNFEMKKDKNNHWSQCTECYYINSISPHTGATHENEGKCTVCGNVYENHNKSDILNGYNIKETTHIPLYACTAENCTETFNGTEAQHTGENHENGGKCKVCGKIYAEHEETSTIKSYITTETTHKPLYKCSIEGCAKTYKGTEEVHEGATHENGGICEACSIKYEEHESSTTISKYEKQNQYHIPVYECVNEDCTETYNGTAAEHTIEEWIDNENGTHSGECIVCNYEVIEEHNYEDSECDKCNAIEDTEEVCEHTYAVKYKDGIHWEECSKCGEIKKGSLVEHTYSNYVDNKNGKHVATCSVCGYKLTENHKYEEGKCKDCKASEPEKACEHSYTTKYDENKHWQECSKCKDIKQLDFEGHIYTNFKNNKDGTHSAQCLMCENKFTEEHEYDENGICTACKDVKPKDDTNNGNNNTGNDNTDTGNGNNNTGNDNKDTSNANKDNSTVKNEIPKAGSQSIVFIIIAVLGVVLVVSIIKMKKYKNI